MILEVFNGLHPSTFVGKDLLLVTGDNDLQVESQQHETAMTNKSSLYDFQCHMPTANARSPTSIILNVSSQHQVSLV